MLASCNDQQVSNIEKKYQDSIAVLKNQLEQANAQIKVLRFPADQRLNQIAELFNAQEYDKVRKEIKDLRDVFPNAKENAEAEKYSEKVAAIEAAKKAEEERIKALGFKAFKDNSTAKFDNTTYSFSGFTYGRTFTFEYVHDVNEYSYEVADKGHTYILASLSISTKENYASNPKVYACEIKDGKLKEIDDFRIEYASYIYTKAVTVEKVSFKIIPFGRGYNSFSLLWDVFMREGICIIITKKITTIKYTYRDPKAGKKNSVSEPINWFGIHNKVGLLHTHGASYGGSSGDYFSITDTEYADK